MVYKGIWLNHTDSIEDKWSDANDIQFEHWLDLSLVSLQRSLPMKAQINNEMKAYIK